MNQHSPEIFDRQRVRRNRDRAATVIKDHNFLIAHAAQNLCDRLDDIKREFPLALQIGCRAACHHDKIGALIRSDLAAGLLDHGGLCVQADEEYLPFAPESFDLVLGLFGLHSVNDVPGALIQARRALKPDGVFLGAMLGGETLFELRQCLMQADIELSGGAGPRVAPLADKQQMGGLMQRAAFALPVIDSEIVTVTYDDPLKLLHDLKSMGEGNSLKERNSAPASKALWARTAEIYRDKFPAENGRVFATFEIIYLIGWAPHESQQKPLRPGSAEINLADVL